MFNYICVLDFEATCDNTGYWEHEIIEFPSVLLKYNEEQNTYIEISRFQKYCKPLTKPLITPFCLELTGITQEKINMGLKFPDVLKYHHDWLMHHTQSDGVDIANITILTYGAWDLCQMLVSEAKRWQVDIPIIYKHFINIKCEYSKYYKSKGFGMAKVLKRLGLSLEGRHHSGIDDCFNTSKILNKMLKDGYVLSNDSITYVDLLIQIHPEKQKHLVN
jgi:inhibitor of KinA sporulation pathway (predicted exonuclease)